MSKTFTKDSGEFISLEKGAKFTASYRVEERQIRKRIGSSVAAFFGENKLQELLANPKAIGIRIYFGLDVDGDGKPDNKFVLVGVDEDGNDLLPSDDATLGKGENDTKILDGGIYCPLDCGKSNPLNSDK